MSPTSKQGPSRLSSSRHKPGKPAPKSSQGGYGHKVSTGGRTTPQGRGRNPANKGPR
jgi:hypothetical protein